MQFQFTNASTREGPYLITTTGTYTQAMNQQRAVFAYRGIAKLFDPSGRLLCVGTIVAGGDSGDPHYPPQEWASQFDFPPRCKALPGEQYAEAHIASQGLGCAAPAGEACAVIWRQR